MWLATNGLNSSFNSILIKPRNPTTATGSEHQNPNHTLNAPASATVFSPRKFPYNSNKAPLTNRPTGKWTNKGCSLAKNIYSTLLLFGATAAGQFRKDHSRSNSNVERLNLFRAGYTHYLIASFFYARREAFLFVAQNQDTGKTYFNIIKRLVGI